MSKRWFVILTVLVIAAFLLGVLYAQPRLIDDGHAFSYFPPLMITRYEDPEIGAWCWVVAIPWSPKTLAVDCEPESEFR